MPQHAPPAAMRGAPGPGAPPPPAVVGGPDALTLLKALRRRWVLATSLGVTAALVALAVAYSLSPVKYSAFASVRIAFTQPTIKDHQQKLDFPTTVKTEAARIKN